MNIMDDEIQCLPEFIKIKYIYMIVTHWVIRQGWLGKDVKYLDLPVDDLE